MAPELRDFLWFMWFIDVFKSHSELISLRFTRVLFGLTCRPFLLNGTIKSDLLKYTQFTDIKKFIEKLLHNLYVDDSVNRFDKLNDCIKFYKVPKSCLTDAGFDLRTAKYVVITVEPLIWPLWGTQLSGRCIRGDRCMEVLYEYTFFIKKAGREKWEGHKE